MRPYEGHMSSIIRTCHSHVILNPVYNVWPLGKSPHLLILCARVSKWHTLLVQSSCANVFLNDSLKDAVPFICVTEYFFPR
jgi:Na+/serine symporter